MMKKFCCMLIAVFSATCLFACAQPSEGGGSTPGDSSTLGDYQVTFLYEDGMRVVKSVTPGQPLTDIPVLPERVGYDAAWDVTDFSNVSSDLTVNAVYTPKTFTIHYDLGECPDATITALTQEVAYATEYQLYVPSSLEDAVYDYQFVKWVKTGTQEEFSNGTYEYTDDVFLTAVWEKFTLDF